MRPRRLLYVSIFVPKRDLTPLISLLHEMGIMHIKRSRPYQPNDAIFKLQNLQKEVGEILSVLRSLKKITIRDLVAPLPLPPKVRVTSRPPEVAIEEAERVLERFKWIQSEVAEIDRLREEIREMEEKIKTVSRFAGCPLKLSDIGEGPYLTILALEGHPEGVEVLWMNEEENVSLIAVRSGEHISSILSTSGASRVELPSVDMTPDEFVEAGEEEISELMSRIAEHRASINRALPYEREFLALEEDLRITLQRLKAASQMGGTRFLWLVEGWIDREDRDRLEEIVNAATGGSGHCEFSPVEDGPVKLRNPWWARPFEIMTDMYARPKYTELDPTRVIALGFIIFFGLMLGDAGYGLVLLIIGLYMRFVIGRASPAVRDLSIIGIELGLATMVFGFLMGSFFGDIIPRALGWDALYHLQIMGIHLPYNAMKEPNVLLVIALTLGFAYMYLGVIIGGAKDLLNRDIRSFVTRRLSWLLLLPCGTLLIFYKFMDMHFSPLAVQMSIILTFVGLTLLALDAKALLIFEITGMMGDILSFIRILALGLATAGVALTINQFVSILGDILGPAFVLTAGVMILIFGHVINTLLQALGAAVHSLRLQFVEFFRRFYEGGGTPFRPFEARRTYTEVKNPMEGL